MRRVPVAALIPSERRELYMTNASFHQAVDNFAALIPHFIEGLAVYAEEVDDWMKEQTRIAMMTPHYMIPPLPDFAPTKKEDR